MKRPKAKKKDGAGSPWQYVTLGLNIAVGFCIFVLGGLWLDNKLKTGVILTLAGACLAFALAMYETYKVSKET